jgi:hypothetical protein
VGSETRRLTDCLLDKKELSQQWHEFVTVPIYNKSHKPVVGIFETCTCYLLRTEIYPTSYNKLIPYVGECIFWYCFTFIFKCFLLVCRSK